MSEVVQSESFVRELIKAGPDAAALLVRRTVETKGRDIHKRVSRHRAEPGFDVERYVDDLVKSQLMLARAEGAGAGAVATAAEMSAFVSGPAAFATLGATMVADLAILAAIQVRLSLAIASAYGHDMDHVDERVAEILSLHSLELTASKAGAPVAANASKNIAKRLLLKYLKGPLLQSLKSMFRVVGIRFAQASLIRGLPLINIPANATIADITTRRTAAKARNYYRTLPTH